MNNFRKDFPIFEKEFDPNNITYLDSAATTLKPKTVISKITRFYEHETANASRGNHFLSENNSIAIDEVRNKTASFINCQSNEIVFTQNTTDAINTVAIGLKWKPTDEIIVSILEHHSNYIPWKNKANIKIAPVTEDFQIDIDKLKSLITPNTKLISITYASNITGNIHSIDKIIEIAKERDILVFIDAAQIVSHMPIDVTKLGCDFLAFSSHKMFGPSGVGILYVKKEAQPQLHPIKFGGGMVNKVTKDEISYQIFPYNFESGTPNIEAILGFGKALDYFREKGFDIIHKQLNYLENYLKKELLKLDFIIVLPFSHENHLPIFTFIPKNQEKDIAILTQTLSDNFKIIVRGGFHCSQLIYNKNMINGGIRISLHIYNTKEDIDKLISSLQKLEFFF